MTTAARQRGGQNDRRYRHRDRRPRFVLAPEVPTAPTPEAGDGPEPYRAASVQQSRAFGNHTEIVHGGTHVVLVDAAMTTVVAGGLHTSTPHALLDIALGFHRPVPIDGRTIGLHTAVRERGNRMVVVGAKIIDAGETLFSSAHGTFDRLDADDEEPAGQGPSRRPL